MKNVAATDAAGIHVSWKSILDWQTSSPAPPLPGFFLAPTASDAPDAAVPALVRLAGHDGAVDERAQRGGGPLRDQGQGQLHAEPGEEGHHAAAQPGHQVHRQEDGHVSLGGVGR